MAASAPPAAGGMAQALPAPVPAKAKSGDCGCNGDLMCLMKCSEPSSTPPTQDEVLASLMILPHASSELLAGVKTGAGLQVYRFTVWVSAPAEVAKQIASVDYFFDHPSFVKSHFVSTMGPDFRQSYEGWGCISRVVATITMVRKAGEPTLALQGVRTQPSTLQTTFDECAAISQAAQ
jgi:hypothetical protein